MVSKVNKTENYTQILNDIKDELIMIKSELAELNKHNKCTTNVNEKADRILVGATFILVAFGFAEIAPIANEPIFSDGHFYLGLLFGLFFVMGLLITTDIFHLLRVKIKRIIGNYKTQ